MPTTIIDACCALNLCATGQLAACLAALRCACFVPAVVLTEALYIRQPDPEDQAMLVPAPIDLQPSIASGVLHVCDAEGEQETGLFVELAGKLDDGEAMCLAIAKARGWRMATDDRKARRLADELGVNVLTTPHMMKTWAEETSAPDAGIAVVLRSIETCARFVPHRTQPLYQWWTEILSKSPS